MFAIAAAGAMSVIVRVVRINERPRAAASFPHRHLFIFFEFWFGAWWEPLYFDFLCKNGCDGWGGFLGCWGGGFGLGEIIL